MNDFLLKENNMSNTPALFENMKPFIQQAWIKSGFAQPTPIQAKAIPYYCGWERCNR